MAVMSEKLSSLSRSADSHLSFDVSRFVSPFRSTGLTVSARTCDN